MRKAILDFDLVEELSSSPSGEVWRAKRRGDGRGAVVKLVDVQSRDDLVMRFHREAQIVSRLAGCRVPALVATGTAGRWHFLVLQEIPGPSLRQLLESEGPLAPARALPIVAGLLDVLAAVHAFGVVHRDIKPDNVIVTPNGPYLVDFGLAKYVGEVVEDDESAEVLTTDDTLLGSLAYMAPEQIDGGFATASGDIYATGVVAFETMAGRVPFDAPTGAAQLTLKRLRNAPRLADVGVRGISAPIDALVASMLRRSPDERPSSARAALDLLRGGVG